MWSDPETEAEAQARKLDSIRESEKYLLKKLGRDPVWDEAAEPKSDWGQRTILLWEEDECLLSDQTAPHLGDAVLALTGSGIEALGRPIDRIDEGDCFEDLYEHGWVLRHSFSGSAVLRVERRHASEPVPAPEPMKPSTYRFCLACREGEGDCHCEFLGKTPAWEERDSKTGQRVVSGSVLWSDPHAPVPVGSGVRSGIGLSIAPVHIAPNEFPLIPVFLLRFERGLVTVDPTAMLPGASVPSLNTEITFLPGPTDQWGVPQHVHGDSSQISEIPSGFVPVIEALKQQYGRISGMDAAIFCPTMDQRYRYAITMLSFLDRKWNIVVVRSPREETGVDDHAHWFLFRRPVDYWRAHERLVGLTMRKLQRSVPKDVTCNCPQGAGSGARK